MFRITYTNYGDTATEISDDIRTMQDILINIVDDEAVETEAITWASNASFGDIYKNKKKALKIECYSEKELQKEIETFINSLCSKAGVGVKCIRCTDKEFIYRLELGTSLVIYDVKTDEFEIKSLGSDGRELYPSFTSSDKKQFTEIFLRNTMLIKKRHEYENVMVLKGIANKLTKELGIRNHYIGEDNGSLTFDFNYGVSYMNNNGGKGLFFAINDRLGKEICTISSPGTDDFISKVIKAFKRIKDSEKIIDKAIKDCMNDLMQKDTILRFTIETPNCKWDMGEQVSSKTYVEAASIALRHRENVSVFITDEKGNLAASPVFKADGTGSKLEMTLSGTRINIGGNKMSNKKLFKITFKDNGKTFNRETTDIKEIKDIVIDISRSEDEANKAESWCNRAAKGDKVVRLDKGYKIECIEGASNSKADVVDNNWHKMYSNGTGSKKEPNDYIQYYYKKSGIKITVSYTDWRHNKACGYNVMTQDGKSVYSTTKLYDAQHFVTTKLENK